MASMYEKTKKRLISVLKGGSSGERDYRFFDLMGRLINRPGEKWEGDHTSLANEGSRGHRTWKEIMIVASQTTEEKDLS